MEENIIRTEVELKIVMDNSSGNYVFDMETDGFLRTCTKMHCLGFADISKDFKIHIITNPKLLEYFLTNAKLLACHNLITYDLPVLKKLFGLEFNGSKIDTLALSYYLRCTEGSHGLGYYGEFYKRPKPEVSDWKEGDKELYIHRVTEDCAINHMLVRDQLAELKEIYKSGGDLERCINYLNFKMECLHVAEENPLFLDIDKINELIKEIESELEESREALKSVMPPHIKFSKRKKPKKMTRKDGSLSAIGERWIENLTELGLPLDWEEDIKIEHSTEEPNPGSHDQIKDWLFSLGWEPCTFKKSTSKTKKNKDVPQVRVDGELTPSVIRLMKDYPEIEHLEDLGVMIHRLGFLNGLIRDSDENGKIVAYAMGFTNTLRLKHSNVVNVPGTKRKYGKEIRSCFIAPEGRTFVGSDINGLESATADHYMYTYDPDYVNEKRTEGFDPHTEIAVLTGLMTKEEEKFYKWFDNKNE